MPSVSLVNSHRKTYKSALKKVKTITKSPEEFLSIQEPGLDEIRSLLQDVYGLTNSKDLRNKCNPEIIPELILEGLDEEQIWQLIELRNNIVWPQFVENTSKLLSLQETKFKIGYADAQSSEASGDENGGVVDENDDISDDGSEEIEPKVPRKVHKSPKRKGKPSIVDDEFFKLSEMEAFLVAEDEKELNKQKGKFRDDEYGINYFDENLDDEDENNIEYKDFFDEDKESSNSLKQSEIDQEEDEEDDAAGMVDDVSESDDQSQSEDAESRDGENEENGDTNDYLAQEHESEKIKSSFQERQERLSQRIKDYEQEILGEKPWQLKGEVQATNRPQNSLLEEILEFEATNRPAPVITEETTLRLEDIIKQRIKDQAWDDVELKVKPLGTPKEFRKQLVLDQEKSKQSLAQIYEKQYQEEVEKLNPNANDTAEEEPALHKEIKSMMRSLFIKLDALSNFHFTPKPVAPEPKIITNTPAVSMEEVAPVAVSDAKLLAPEEVRNRAKGDIIGSNERSKTDKNRSRRQKKQKQRAIHKVLEERDIEKQKLGLRLSKKDEQAKVTKDLTKHRNVEKISISNDNTATKSSKAFFSKLQETTSEQIKNKRQKKPESNSLSAKRLKL